MFNEVNRSFIVYEDSLRFLFNLRVFSDGRPLAALLCVLALPLQLSAAPLGPCLSFGFKSELPQSDEAFAKRPKGTVEGLLADKDALTAVLTYHVVAGKVTSDQVVKIDSAPTVQGQSLKIKAKRGVRVDNAKVIMADVEASNGVIHVIDTVLLP